MVNSPSHNLRFCKGRDGKEVAGGDPSSMPWMDKRGRMLIEQFAEEGDQEFVKRAW